MSLPTPSDLTKFAPSSNRFYGYESRNWSNPFKIAPSQSACGGVTYFDNDLVREDFEAFLRVVEVSPNRGTKEQRHYTVFTKESKKPGEDGYLTQTRIVSRFALGFMFMEIDDSEYENFPEQKLTVAETLWEFIEHEKERWGTSYWQDSIKGLKGLFGGDGYFAREKLSFGFMVENSYYGIYRIWSRAWLVTK